MSELFNELYVPPEGGYVSLHMSSNDRAAYIPAAGLNHWTVDWTVKSGRINLATKIGQVPFQVTFAEDDGGQECVDAIGDLVRLVKP